VDGLKERNQRRQVDEEEEKEDSSDEANKSINEQRERSRSIGEESIAESGSSYLPEGETYIRDFN
jgi:hypothetical protein